MVFWLAVILIVFVLLQVLDRYKKNLSAKAKLAEIKARWSQPILAARNFKLIAAYLDATTVGESMISSETASDLDLEGVFAYIDRISSKPGQQYLYQKLHCLETSESYLTELEQRIDKQNTDQQSREHTQLKLAELGGNDAYYLPELFSKEHRSLFRPLTKFYIRLSATVMITLIVLLVMVPNQFYLLLILVMLITNLVIHF